MAPPEVKWETDTPPTKIWIVAGFGSKVEVPAITNGTKVRATCSNYQGSVISSVATLTVAKPPTATITSPTPNKTYLLNSKVKTTFACAEGENGPGIESCTDNNGGKAPGGSVNTSALGLHYYEVTAKSADGAVKTARVKYMVVPAKGWKGYEFCGSAAGCTHSLLFNTTTKAWSIPDFSESGTIETVGKPAKTNFVVTSEISKGCVYYSVKTTLGYNSPTSPGAWQCAA